MWIAPSELTEFEIPPRILELLMENLNDIESLIAE
jgi:hypothetical protein